MLKTSKGFRWTVGAIAGVVGLVFLLDAVIPSVAVRHLPQEATGIQEYYQDYGMTGDFVRLLKARIPENQVAEYARKVGAVNRAGDGNEKGVSSWTTREVDWFMPRRPPMYYHSESGYRVIVGWEDGYVYLDAIAW